MNKRVLGFGAHPDDVEILFSGTLLLLKELGYEVHIATMTLGDCGSDELSQEEISQVRRSEAEKSCQLLGADYHYAGFTDFCVLEGDSSNRKAAAVLREVNPSVVFTHPPSDYMNDHEVASKLVRNACFIGPVPNYDTSEFGSTGLVSAIPHLYYAQPVENKDIFGNRVVPHFYVDISDLIDRKADLLACHQSQRDWLRDHHGMDEYLDSMRRWNADLGQAASQLAGRTIKYAEGFTQHLGHAYPQDNVLKELLPERIVEATEA